MPKTIKICRSREIFQTKSEAISFLSRTPHQAGREVLARFWTSENDVDAVLAIGTKTGIGPGCYSIVSVGNIRVIEGIAHQESDLPDSSQIINAEIWLFQEPVTNDLYWIFIDVNIRKVEPVNPSISYHVFVISDNSEYWIFGGNMSRANDYYSRESMDQILSGLSDSYSGYLEALRTSIMNRLSVRSDSIGLDQNDGYPGTIPGATSFDEADQALYERLTQNEQGLRGATNRISDLERELKSATEGLSGITRLDDIWDWYDTETHKPTGTITFSRMNPESPLIIGSIQRILVSYRWAWADYGNWEGIGLNSEVKRFGQQDVGPAATNNGLYGWSIGLVVQEEPTVLTAFFAGSGLEPVTYTIEPIPRIKNINVSGPDPVWNRLIDPLRLSYSIDFAGTGLPPTEIGTEVSVIKSPGTRLFQGIQGGGPEWTTTYHGFINPNENTVIMANWGDVSETVSFTPLYLVVLEPGLSVTLENIENSGKKWVTLDMSIETPEITFEAGQTVVILSPESMENSKILCKSSGYSEPIMVTPEFTESTQIEYNNTTYNYRAFPNIGAGTFKFTIK